MDGAEEDGVGGEEGRRAVELEDGDAAHVVLAGLAQADVVVEGQDPLGRDGGQQRAVEVEPLLQLLGGEEAGAVPRGRQQHREADVEDTGGPHVRVRLDVEEDDAVAGGGQDGCHPLQEAVEQGGEESLLGHVGQAQGDAVAQHLVRDHRHPQRALGRRAVDPICGLGRGGGRRQGRSVTAPATAGWGWRW